MTTHIFQVTVTTDKKVDDTADAVCDGIASAFYETDDPELQEFRDAVFCVRYLNTEVNDD